MAVLVSMLRAVNVGGHRKVSMETLRRLYEALDLKDARTHIQSGNVVFRTGERDSSQVARRIEAAIEHALGFRSEVIVRTRAQLRAVIESNPFDGRPEVAGGKLLVTFLAADPGEAAREAVRQINMGPEELFAVGSELFVHYPNGAGRSKLPNAVEQVMGIPGTTRNWNSVLRILAMAEEMEQL